MKKNEKERLFEVTGRLDKTFKPISREIIPEQQAGYGQSTVAQQPEVAYVDQTYKMIAPALKRIRTVQQFPVAFKGWFAALGYNPQSSPLTIAQARIAVENAMRELGYK